MPSNENWKQYSPFVSALLDSFVPDHIRANYPNLIEFIAAYLDFLETTHESGYYQNAIPQQRDIDSQEEQFLHQIEQEIGLFVPREYEATPRLFYKKISDLWRSKGSQEAIETFFRLFLNDTVQVRYPWDSVLKPSDGRWQAPRKLRVSLISGDPDTFASRRIQQIEEYGFATVTRVERKVYADQTIYELTILRGDTVGEFKVGNRITTEDQSVVAEIYNSVSNIVINSPGSGYEVGDRIRLEGRSRISFEARVTEVNLVGGITSVSVLDFGSGTTPTHIFDVQGSGRYYLDGFRIFQYASEDRDLDLGDNLDFAEDSIEGFKQNYTTEVYFLQSYVGETVFFETNESLVNAPLQTSSIITTPADPTDPLTFEVDSAIGTGASFSLEFGPIVESAGYYDGVRGQLSEAIVLQDSEFYQKFSYEVITSFPIEQWIEPLKTHVHPSGTKPFGLINKTDRINARNSIFSDDVIELPPRDRVNTFENRVKTFTKKINECAVCRDDTAVLSEEDISFTKRIFESAVATENVEIRLGNTYRFEDIGVASDFGLVTVQNYNNDFYFSSDYVGQSTSF